MTHTKSSREIYTTTNYDAFISDSSNRPIHWGHVKELAKYEVIKIPLLVHENEDGKLVITDGQHRFEALKMKGQEVEYIIDRTLKSDEDAQKSMQELNRDSKNWSVKDYVFSKAKRGFGGYKEFLYHIELVGAQTALKLQNFGTGTKKVKQVDDKPLFLKMPTEEVELRAPVYAALVKAMSEIRSKYIKHTGNDFASAKKDAAIHNAYENTMKKLSKRNNPQDFDWSRAVDLVSVYNDYAQRPDIEFLIFEANNRGQLNKVDFVQ